MQFPLFALVFAPFWITYIASEHGPEHTPDWGLAFMVEVGWLVFLVLIINVAVAIHKAVKSKRERVQPAAPGPRQPMRDVPSEPPRE
jgi:hypothetical protein